MTVFVGKDYHIYYDIDNDSSDEKLEKVKEFSLEVNNGKKDVWGLGSEQLVEYVYTGISVSGSLNVQASADDTNASLKNLMQLVLPSNALPSTSPTKDMIIKVGDETTPTYTLTLTDVSWDSYSFSSSPDGDPVTVELSFTAKVVSVA